MMQADQRHRSKLRIAVILDRIDVPAWQAATLLRLVRSDYAQIVLAVLSCGDPADAQVELEPRPRAENALERLAARPLLGLLRVLEAKIECKHDPFASADGGALLADTEILRGEAAALARGAAGERKLDVVLDLRSTATTPCADFTATHGVWRVVQPYTTTDAPATSGFWPVCQGWAVMEVVLEQRLRDGTRRIVARAFPATHPHSMKLTRANLYWRVASLLPHKLQQLHRSPERFAETVDRACDASTGALGSPTIAQLGGHITRNIARRARASLARRFENEQWILLYRFGEELSLQPETFTAIVPPADRFWADPHVVRCEGRYYIFIEECPFATGKGHISVLALDTDGSYGTPEPVLVRDYHLSYPYIFEHDGTFYMVPESEANRTVDLYRCVLFPTQWQWVTTLISDIAATDATVFEHDGRWWMFANVVDVEGAAFSEELYLYHSELLAGPWRPHQKNPLISDARRARPGGGVIRRNGGLYRPAQDCSVRYGFGIRLHEITTLTPSEYAESEVASIMPVWDRRIIATHTLSYTPGLTVIDALRPRLKLTRAAPQ